ncbi:hypothetical protein AFM16_16790 [Streptomyces antibioticus]|uniref:Transposase n=1 Tax=Streptomyces antibioticus TaxID=1890 RepID=A0ABX3LIQ0_STRAT|nr:hypothetical protein AFM16_16790 [Streptomyces antibioticus]
MSVLAWVTDTVQGTRCSRARRVFTRWSWSRSYAACDASVSSAGEMVRRIVEIQLFASASVCAA